MGFFWIQIFSDSENVGLVDTSYNIPHTIPHTIPHKSAMGKSSFNKYLLNVLIETIYLQCHLIE